MATPLVIIHQDSLSLPPLTIGDDVLPFQGGPEADQALRWGGKTWTRQMANSPWVHGEVLVGANQQNSQLELRFICLGNTETEMLTRWDAVAKAFGQFTFQIDVFVGSEGFAFTAWVSDIAMAFDRFTFKAFAARASAVVPVMPIGVLV